ncbi:hypothetical protein CAPTEDRAFT_37306, partial [Capitella teleta]
CTDLNTPKWQPIQQPPFEIHDYSACASPGGFVVSGGLSQNSNQRDCYSYDAQNGQWNTLPPMPSARREHSLIYHNHHLYVIGGYDGSPLNSVDALDMRNLQWNHLPPLPRKVSFAYLAIVSDNLFVLGGCCGLNWVADVHEFDLTQQTWRQRSPMP